MAYSNPYQRPENILKHAEDFIKIGKQDQALQLLYELLSNKRQRTFTTAHEDVMKRFIELSILKQNARVAKEGLHQYRNLTIHQAPASLEMVIEYLLSIAEEKTAKAAKTCDMAGSTAVEDLENDKSPEAILLESLVSNRSKVRTEQEHLVPWLRFLWESYRAVLEILRNIGKMETLYHKTTHRIFDFCVKYNRSTEFRKLCETLRTHSNKRKEEEHGPDSVELHLASRFEQLKVSSTLRLWNEGFRTIDDIHTIFQKSEKRPSSQLEATYYNKLTDLFLVSKNYLFHAYAYNAYYQLSIEKNKSLSPMQIKVMASCVLLSSMSIPLPTTKVGTTYAYRDSQKQKNRKMAQLLGFDINPKRKSILQDLLDKDVLENVLGHVRDLYLLLECTFAPLDLVSKVMPIIQKIRESEEQASLLNYLEPLEKLLIIRVVVQLSKVFYSVTLSTLKRLLKPLNKNWLEIEDIIIKAVKSRQIDVHSVRIDQIADCIRFGEDFMEEERTRHLLSDMSRGLNTICLHLEPKAKAKLKQVHRQERAATVLKHLDSSHQAVLKRKDIIEKRKDEYAKMQQARKIDNERRRKEMERQRKEAEEQRLETQRVQREKNQLEALEQEKRNFEWRQKLLMEGVDISKEKVSELSHDEQVKLLEDTRKKQLEETMEAAKKFELTSQKLDTLVRAMREKELPLRKAKRKKDIKKGEEEFEKSWENHFKNSVTEHEDAIKAKKQYARMQPSRAKFEVQLMNRWTAEYEKERKKRWTELDQRLKHGKLERARKTKKSKQKEIQRAKDEKLRLEREKKAYGGRTRTTETSN